MTTRNGWRSARGHIVFLLAMLTAFAIVYALERWETDRMVGSAWRAASATPAMNAPTGRLTAAQLEDAQAAWAYFERNIEPQTGLANSVAGYSATTMWDTGSFLIATIAAERLGILPRERFDAIIAQALGSLAEIPLHRGDLPNKSYDTRTLLETDYNGVPVSTGIGWSALDTARMLVPLHVLAHEYSWHAEAVQAVLGRWNLSAAVHDGRLMGARPAGAEHELVQEGRLGYEQYGARAFALMGLDVGEASRIEPNLTWIDIDGVQVPLDRRGHNEFGAHTYTLSEPFLLAAFEFGLDAGLQDLSWRLLQAQERRFERTGHLTAVSEDHLDRAPYFAFSAIIADGEPWGVLAHDGESAEAFRTLSAKAAIGWSALYRTSYTEQLADAAGRLRTPDGWQAGIYEASNEPNAVLAANTNAVILEAMHFRAFGPLLHPQVRREASASNR